MFLLRRGKMWYIQYKNEEGLYIRKSTGCRKKAEALETLRTMPFVDEDTTMLIDQSKIYLSKIEKTKSKKYLTSVAYSLRHLQKYVGAKKTMATITHKTIDNFLTDIFMKSPYAARVHFRNLKAFFNDAIALQIIDNNPLKKIKLPKMDEKFPIWLSEEQFNSLICQEPQEMLKDIFTISFFTGMRAGEVLMMQQDWIDKNLNVIVVKKGKNNVQRKIPMTHSVRSVLARHKGNPVFRHSTVELTVGYLSHQFKDLLRRYNNDPNTNIGDRLPDELHLHSLRHSFGSNLASKGISIYIIKELMGHSSVVTTEIYSHLQQSSLHDAMKVLELPPNNLLRIPDGTV